MATTRISALTELTNPASTDVLVINDVSVSSTKKIQLSNLIPDDAIDSEHYVAGSIDNEHLANDAVGIDELSATGTASSSTFLRGDNSWVTPTDTNTTYSVQDGELSEINFTSADHTKLNAIEASADVTDATNVTAAGALMDSELAGIAAVKATTGTFLTADQTKLDGIETSATADQTGAEIKTAYEAEANAYTDTKNTKLAGIETSATADQTAGEILTLIEDGIDSVHYVDASIDNVHLAANAVDSAEIAAGAIDTSHIGSGVGARCVYSGWDSSHSQTGVGVWQTPTLDYHYQTFDTDYCSAYSTTGIQCDKAGHYLVRLRLMMYSDLAGSEFQTRILISGAQAGYTFDCTPGSKWQTQTLMWAGALTTSDYVQGEAYVKEATSSYFNWHQASGPRYSAIDLIYLGS